MGTGVSNISTVITYHNDRGGVYTIDETINQRTYRWFTDETLIEIIVFIEANSVRAHLVKFKKGQICFDNEYDGHVDITVNDTIEINDVFLKHQGICSESTTKTMFCALRTYVERFGRPVFYGHVTITSKNAKAAFQCYCRAFANNGFETDSTPPCLDIINNWCIRFIKTIKKPLKLS